MNKIITFPKKLKAVKNTLALAELKTGRIRKFAEGSKESRAGEFLKAIKAGEFPLRSSLFWKDPAGGGHDGSGYRSTWELLKRNWNAATRDRLVNKQIEYNSNMITYYLYHFDDPGCVVNPFVGNPSPAKIAAGQAVWDDAEIAKWMPYIQLGTVPGLWVVPSIFCGDSRPATNNTAFHDVFLPPAVIALHPYLKAISLGSEMSKTMNRAQMERMVAVIKNAWISAGLEPRFVGVHLQCDREGNLPVPGNIDFIMLETSNHPKNYRDSNDICNEIRKAIAKCPVPILVSETYIFCEEAKARAVVRDIAKINGVWCLPGPI